MSTASNPVFDPDAFHQQFPQGQTGNTAGGFDPDEFHAKYSGGGEKTEFEKQRTEGEDRGFGAGAASAIGAPDTLGEAAKQGLIAGMPGVGLARNIYQTVSTLPQHLRAGWRAGKETGVDPLATSIAYGASPMVGVNPESMEARAERADTTGILGEAAVPAAQAIAAPVVGEAIAPVSRMVSRVRTTPFDVANPRDPLGGRSGPGASQPLADDFYANRGRELNAIRRMQPQATVAPPTVQSPSGVAAPTAQVVRVPVPREPLPGEDPAYMASIPRARLLDLARQGRPGAAEQARNVGKTLLYVVPEGYPGPRAEVAPPGELHGNATPFEKGPVAGPELEKAGKDYIWVKRPGQPGFIRQPRSITGAP